MTGTASASIKVALVEALTAAVDPVEVRYAIGGLSIPREVVYLGRITGQQTFMTFRPGVGKRMPRREELKITVHVRIENPGDTAQESEDRAATIGGQIEDLIAADPTLGGVLLIQASTSELVGGADDGGGFCLLTYTFTAIAELT